MFSNICWRGCQKNTDDSLCIFVYLIAEMLIQPWKHALADFLFSYNLRVIHFYVEDFDALLSCFFYILRLWNLEQWKAMMIRRLRFLGNQKDFHFKKTNSLHLCFMISYLHKTLRSFKKGFFFFLNAWFVLNNIYFLEMKKMQWSSVVCNVKNIRS